MTIKQWNGVKNALDCRHKYNNNNNNKIKKNKGQKNGTLTLFTITAF